MTPPTDTSPGTRIRERREALNLRRESLAHYANVSAKTIERIEAGGTPRPVVLDAIDAALEKYEAGDAA